MKNVLVYSIFVFLLAFSSKAQVPDSPVLSEPPDVDIVVSPTTTLAWQNVENATSYEVQISTYEDFSVLVNSIPIIVSINHYEIPEGLLSNFTVYHWRVRARNYNGPGEFCAAWSFRTKGTPPEEINSLQNVVLGYGAMNTLNHAQIHFLIQKLDKALNYYVNNKIFLANLNMGLFKLRVYVLLISNFLTFTEAQVLIYNADKIINLINGDSVVPEVSIPNVFELKQNYPNPFNPATTIEYTIPENSRVVLKVYDLLGKEVATLVDKEQNAGSYIVMWNANSVSSGIYFYRITAGKYNDTKRMVLKK